MKSHESPPLYLLLLRYLPKWDFHAIVAWLCFWGHSYGSLKTLYRRRQWQPIPVLLPGKSHGWRSLVGYSPWGRWESDTTERLHFHFSLSCIGEGNGNPLQCSCLENLRDRGAWWAAVHGVAQSQTQLKQLSSSSSKTLYRGGRVNRVLASFFLLKDFLDHCWSPSDILQTFQVTER